MFGFSRDRQEELIASVVKRVVSEITTETENKLEAMHARFRSIETLEAEISKLKIEKSVKEEEFARREREVTHKLGLERIRQEQDAANLKKELAIEVREKNISQEETRFKAQMEFERKHLENQINSLNVLVEKVFDKLPQVSHETKVIKRIGGSTGMAVDNE